MINLYCFGTNFRICGLENMEKISFNKRELELLYATLKDNNFENVVVLSTCNRLEVYWTDTRNFKDTFIKIIAGFKSGLPQIIDNFYFLEGMRAFKHLMFVILGIDSMLTAEEDIVSQVKNSYISSDLILTLDKSLHIIFQKIIYYSRYLRNKYNFAQFRYSLTDCMMKIILKIFSRIDNKNILVLGTGIIAKNIINRFYGKVKNIYVSSRHTERVNNLIAEINKKIEILSDLSNLNDFDIIIGTTTTHTYLINKNQLQGSRKEKIMLFDLGVPRNISPDISDLNNTFLFSLDDIYNFHQSLFKEKMEAFQHFKEILEKEIEKMWSKIIVDTEPIDWINLKEVIKSSVIENLNSHKEKEINESVVNKISHTILKNIKKYLIEQKL